MKRQERDLQRYPTQIFDTGNHLEPPLEFDLVKFIERRTLKLIEEEEDESLKMVNY